MGDKLNNYLLNAAVQPSNREIARAFGVSEATVRRRRKKLALPPSEIKSNTDQPGLTVSGTQNALDFKGLVTENPLDPSESGAFVKIFELAGLNQDDYELVQDTFKFTTWQQSKGLESGERTTTQLYSYKGTFRAKGRFDIAPEEAAALLTLAAQGEPRPAPENDLVRVVVAGDFQAGKVDQLGGTTELLERLADKTAALEQVLSDSPCAESYLFDPGDLTEGFENVSSQRFLNDLSLPSMLRVGRAILTRLITTLVPYGKTTVVTVPSNHGAWRSGKGYLGKPSDDFGLDIHAAVQDVFAQTKHQVEWVVPNEWDESVVVDIGNVKVGLVHGHQTKSNNFKNWWQGQALGSGPVAEAHICISGHYHNTLLETCGFISGRERYHIQSPPMDNGSSWWRNLTGEQSTPGIITFMLCRRTGEIIDFRVV